MSEKKITIIRKPYMPDYYRNYRIYCNRKRIGDIELDSEFSFQINEDSEICLKIDWCRSNIIKIDNSFSDDIKIEVFPAARGWRMLFYFYYMSLGWKNYLTLKVLKS
ncbi:hypothetical protein [Chryseobacterium polytrichastri]|uniref:Uncharacterized protein n=1 Tax=Chryseobacterium polytrichastri TaxID=1302687 RepID=A0A1M7FC81_9FLAO|nr:hypothetical protein [Chryseobacterium polytrichastri]SHM01555.1 hypothetical protein SAMN05444267_103138 [Chryseobacterium polytrichastri]